MKPVLVLVVLLGLAGCASAEVVSLPTTGRVDYQLGGAWAPPADVTVVARDSTDPPLAGVYSICYLNGFQTQPQQAEFWLDEHPDLLLRDADGDPQFDENWPDEMALDTSTAEDRAALASIIDGWIEGCRASRYQAVEFDNLDSYSRFAGISLENNVALATALVRHAHSLGLAAGQKNTAELGTRGRDDIGFDFVISEECFVFDECGGYRAVYGEQFIDIEYQRSEASELDGLCDDPDVPFLTIVRDRDLSPGDDPNNVFWSCDT
jgi:hypothetical protein